VHKKRVLVLSPYNPFQRFLGAPELTLRNRLGCLAPHYEITLVTLGIAEIATHQKAEALGVRLILVPQNSLPAGKARGLRKLWNLMTGKLAVIQDWQRLSRTLTAEGARIHTQTKFDLIHFESTIVTAYSYLFPVAVHKLVFVDNCFYIIFWRMALREKNLCRRAAKFIEYLWVRRVEKKWLKPFNFAATLSKIETKRFARLNSRARQFEIPLDINLAELKTMPAQAEEAAIVFVGTMSYPPNEQGATSFISQIFPRLLKKDPNLKLYLVGKNPSRRLQSLASSNIVITGAVDDITPYLHKSRVFVVPIFVGGGMRYKILEAFAHEKAVVSTTVGAEGIEYEVGTHLMIANTARDFADRSLELYLDPGKRKRMGLAARQLVEKKYSTQVTGREWIQAYQTIFNSVAPMVS
jgi:glycosyltransferase involved in cell wall biosynthesis